MAKLAYRSEQISVTSVIKIKRVLGGAHNACARICGKDCTINK